jgi:SAM-dependent methyltransferase
MFAQSAAWYDRFFDGKDYLGEARQVTALIRRYRPGASTLLDVACGTGRHLEQLRDTFTCEGLDLDAGLLEVARKRLPGVGLTQGDMADFDLGRRYDAVTCLFSSIGYVCTTDRLHAAVGSMARHLQLGGVLIVEPWILPEAWIDGRGTVSVVNDDDRHKLVRVHTSRRRGRLSILRMHYVIAAGGELTVADERHELGLFSRDEYLAAFAAADLEATWDPDGLTGRGLLIGVAA